MAWYKDMDDCLTCTFRQIGQDIIDLRAAIGQSAATQAATQVIQVSRRTIDTARGRVPFPDVEQMEKITITGEGMTLSKLVWNRFHEPKPGLVEWIMDVNPNIAKHGEYLPVGLSVMMPIEETPSDEAVIETVSLWD